MSRTSGCWRTSSAFSSRPASSDTTDQALCWAKRPQNARPYRWRKRLRVVRLFARYLATIDPDAEIPSKDLFPATRQRLAPYIYSPEEIAALMDATRALKPPSRAATFKTLIGLLAATRSARRSHSIAKTSVLRRSTACPRRRAPPLDHPRTAPSRPQRRRSSVPSRSAADNG